MTNRLSFASSFLASTPLVLLAGIAACGDDAGTGGATTTNGTSSSGPSTSPTTTTAGTTTTTSATTATTAASSGTGQVGDPVVRVPSAGLRPEDVGVIVNDQDPQSVAVGAYYATARGIPAANVITVSFPATGSDNLTATDFAPIKQAIDDATPASVQAYAVTWTYPTRVDCMSITTALTFGFDDAYCNTSGLQCGLTATSPYFDTGSSAPFDDFGMRPAMVLAGASVDDVKALIDRGVAADGTFPPGEGWFVRTTDTARSVRWPDFVATIDTFDHDGCLSLTYVDNASGAGSNQVEGATDVLFYFTGLATVPGIETNTYRPGAIADHLTSYGGSIPPAGQTNVLAWLSAGVTGSYGTVVEPCNYAEKFPRTDVVLDHYFRGETLIESYWKSVRWPGEGLFVGEPLARPWGVRAITFAGGVLTIETTTLVPGRTYALRAADTEAGPWVTVLGDIATPDHRLVTITLPDATAPFYELVAP